MSMQLKRFPLVFLPITAVLFFDGYIIYNISLGNAKTARRYAVLKSLYLCSFWRFMLPATQTFRYCYFRMYGRFAYFKYLCRCSYGGAVFYYIFTQNFRTVFRVLLHTINSRKGLINCMRNTLIK